MLSLSQIKIYTMRLLSKYELVNKCETLEELANAILEMADGDGNIHGRTRAFSATAMAFNCKNFTMSQPNLLTREFGIRQQAMYIFHYIN